MTFLVAILTTTNIVLRLKNIMNAKDNVLIDTKDETSNGATWSSGQYWTLALHQYGVPFMQFWINLIYGIYLRFTFINAVSSFLYVNKCRRRFIFSQARLHIL